MKETENQAIVIVDLGFGDAGKGSVVDYLSRVLSVHTVIRYNGGTQAAHNVITPEGVHHTFRQFGSGTLVDGVQTHLSRFMLLDPLSLLKEEEQLRSIGVTDAFKRTTIDRRCVITTPFHQAVNRLKEISRSNGRHGSCGLGIGETMSDFLQFGEEVLFVEDLLEPNRLVNKLKFLKSVQVEKVAQLKGDLAKNDQAKKDWQLLDDPQAIDICANVYKFFAAQVKIVDPDYLRRLLRRPGTVLFEGAQGVLLDQNFGFYPHTTWTDTTAANAMKLLTESDYVESKLKLGVIRTYSTRHGAGPFVTEDAYLTQQIPELHNRLNPWQGSWRNGYLDLVLSRYAMEVTGGIDGVALTHLDRLASFTTWKAATSYRLKAKDLAEPFFETSGDDLIRIFPPTPPVETARQGQLNQLLYQLEPVYSAPFSGDDLPKIADFVAEQLKCPILLFSSGPTALDKQSALERRVYEPVA